MKYKYNGQWYDVSIKALDGMPIGAIIAYPRNNIPNGWLECNGSSITSANYPELYDLIGGTLPDLRGRVIVGQDTSQTEFDTLGETGGSKYLQNHKHKNLALGGNTMTAWSSTGSGGVFNIESLYQANQPNNNEVDIGYVSETNTGDSGNLQPYVVYKWIIKAKQTTPLIASVVNSNSASTTDTYSCNYLNTAIPVLAYDGSTSGEVTLNTSTTNYNFIEIIYTGADSSYSSSGRIPIIQNMTISLINHSFRDNEGTICFWVSTVLLSGNKLTPQTSKWAWYTNGSGYGVSQGNYVNVKKVYLYK